MPGNVTQRDIAEHLGISYLTVNRVLSASGKSSGKVGHATRGRILDAAQLLGYRRNIHASNLVLQRTSTIGVVWPHHALSYYQDVVSALERKARESGYQVVLTHRASPGTGSRAEVEFLLDRRVDGLIVAPDQQAEEAETFQVLAQAGTPVLLFNSFIPGIPCHYLGTDSRRGSNDLARHILELGHRRVTFVAGPENDYTSRSRREGFLDGIRMIAGDEPGPNIVSAGGFDVEDGRRVAEEVLAMPPRPTAVIAANDALAIGLFLEFRRHGLDIPGDVSLAGYAGMWE
ncbi:MAG: LacI family DNA-binding transcriptional regulator, partial [Lentisphaerae bacterium]|nr:LacI family DNA-binding transcriptional regulator [Lentisphaerota bacterium]